MPATIYKPTNNQDNVITRLVITSQLHCSYRIQKSIPAESYYSPFEFIVGFSESERQRQTALLLKDFSFSDFESVYYFIDEHQLLSILLDAPEQATKYFGTDSKLHLEVFHDEEENQKVLTLFIGNNLEPEQAYQQEQLLYTEWFLKHFANLSDKLSIRECPMFE